MKSPPERLFLGRLSTPIGTMLLATDEEGRLRALDWEDYESRMHRLLDRHYGPQGILLEERALPDSLQQPLEAYFAGQIAAVDRIAVFTNGTPFQREVWAALRRIPAGTTLSYGRLAETLGRSKAVRAVGLANGANPIGLVVPCHRVIGADGSLVGYGGGLHRKRWLLAHEGALPQAPKTLPATRQSSRRRHEEAEVCGRKSEAHSAK